MKKHMNFKVYSVFITAAIILAVVLLNTLTGVFLAWKPIKLDMTQNQIYTLSDRTTKTVKNLSEPVDVYVLFSEEMEESCPEVRQIMDRYAAIGDKLTVSYKDPVSDYEFYKNYTEKGLNLSDGSIVLESKDKLRTLSVGQFYADEAYGQIFNLERMMTSALVRITGADGGKIYMVSNHGEYNQAMAEYFEMNAIDYALLDLNKHTVEGKLIPEDASLVMVIAPQYDYSELELALLDGYLENNGKAIFSFAYEYGEMPYLYSYLNQAWGLKVEHGLVMEKSSSYKMQTPSGEEYNTAKLENHVITASLISSDLPYLAPFVVPVFKAEENAYFATVTPLAKTSEQSVISASSKGPYAAAALSETTTDKNSKVLYIGAVSTLVDLTTVTATNLANGDFILNAIDYMTDTSSSMEIRSKNLANPTMTMTAAEMDFIYYVLKLAIPGVIILLGIAIWLIRRFK